MSVLPGDRKRQSFFFQPLTLFQPPRYTKNNAGGWNRLISLPVVIISIVLFFVLFFGIGFLLNMLLRMSWIMAVIYPIVCLFIISKEKLISYVQSPGESFASLFHRVLSLAAADVLILVSGLAGAIVSGIAINMLRKRGYQMF